MKAELKSLASIDIDERTYWPDIEDTFGFNIEASIGPEKGSSFDNFTFFVCTPQWIASKSINQDFGDFGVFGRHMLVVAEYYWEKIRSMIEKLCAETTGKGWDEVAHRLARFGMWEYEDHQEIS
ncbi:MULTISPECIES: Imm8 family immunity protein [Falsihalocynthiibacter]|uniref:Imm8 family immunity protein n=1 Tax=Falsihalocynthiibacter TaxID=2854182 RepID=UPI0030031931